MDIKEIEITIAELILSNPEHKNLIILVVMSELFCEIEEKIHGIVNIDSIDIDLL